jgi:hypothetical protein
VVVSDATSLGTLKGQDLVVVVKPAVTRMDVIVGTRNGHARRRL